jgi:hypothetical protein
MPKVDNVADAVTLDMSATNNVIMLPFVERLDKKPEQQLLFVEPEHPASLSPQLIEKAQVKKRKAKAASAKKTKVKKPAKKIAAKKVKVPKAKAATKTARAKASVKVSVAATPAVVLTAPVIAPPMEAPALVAPIVRGQAPVVWRKNGPIDAVRYWLRSMGRNVVNGFASAPRKDARSRKDLLLEIAALRQENAEMRERLGLPAMPFGRQVADTL